MKIRWVTPILTRVEAQEKYIHEELEVGIVPAIFNFFQGRATTFAIVYGIVGVVFAIVAVRGFIHKQDLSSLASVISSFALFLGALQAMLFAHSCKEDWVDIQHRKLDLQAQAQTQGSPANVNVTVNSTDAVPGAPKP